MINTKWPEALSSLYMYKFNYSQFPVSALHREKKKEKDREELWKKLEKLEVNNKTKIKS